jgi:hypothetical protein
VSERPARRAAVRRPAGALEEHLADIDTTGSGLAAALTRLADERGPDVESPAVPTVGSDPDADGAELFYPDLHRRHR